jgi:hypothetical protein
LQLLGIAFIVVILALNAINRQMFAWQIDRAHSFSLKEEEEEEEEVFIFKKKGF